MAGCQIEKKNYIYGLTQNDVIVYVGKTFNLYERIVSHKKHKKFNNFIVLEEVQKESDLDFYEDFHIKRLNPKYNKRLNFGCKKYVSLSKICLKNDVDYLLLAKQLTSKNIYPVFSDNYDFVKISKILEDNKLIKLEGGYFNEIRD